MVESLLQQIAVEYKKILKENMVGIYVHGSIAFGCYNPSKSDIDFLVVTDKEPLLDQKVALIQFLIESMPQAPVKGFEMSLVLKKYCHTFVYPTPYELHFGSDLLAEAKNNIVVYCKGSNGLDPDLAAHFTVLNAVGVTCVGQPIIDVFSPVPPEAYLDSIFLDIENAKEHIHKDPVYVILNLCRVLAYVQGEVVMSKKQGGEWGRKNIPEFEQLINRALVCYSADSKFEYNSKILDLFALNLLQEIKTSKPLNF